MTAQLISSYTIDYDILTQGFIRDFRKSNKLSRDLSADVINLIIQFYYSIQPACVIDNGSGLIKTGFSGAPVPSSVTPSIVGKLNYKNAKPLMVTRFNTVGDERIYKYPQIFSWQHPVQHGIITNFEAMEKIWHHSFYQELHIDPERTHILLTEPPLNPKANREKTTQIMFESFNVKGLYIAVGEVLSLYASGRTTGVVLGSGDRVTHAVPIYEGYYLQHAVQRLDLAGKDCTDYLMNRLTQKGNIFDTFRTTNAERKIVKNIKETLCFVALDFGWEYHKDVRQNYQLPDGQIITVEEERYRTPEILFQPNYLIGSNQEGMHKILFNSIMECNDAIKNKLFENIVLSGGNTMFEGFAKRMEKEMKILATDTCKIKIIAPEERAYLEWIGGSILSSLSSFETMWISKGEYDEYGPSIVHRKCS